MYAVVKTGGKQYRVEQGQYLLVEKLAADEGSTIELQPVLFAGDQSVFDAEGLKNVKVSAKILGHEKGEKLRVFKFKPKRGYKRTAGHRQKLTRIEITEISHGA
jgi:large subunit ribosomal protein L21